MTPGSWQLSGCCIQTHHLLSSCGQQPLPDIASSSSGTWSWTSSTLATKFSLWVSKEGSLPMLFRSGPRIYGTCLNRDSGAKKSYLLASFLTRFLLFSSVPWCSYGRFIHSLSLITVLLVSQNIYGELGKGNELKPDSAEKCLSFWGHSSSRWSEDPPFPEHFGTCVDSHAGLPALSHTGCHRRLHCSWCLVPQ